MDLMVLLPNVLHVRQLISLAVVVDADLAAPLASRGRIIVVGVLSHMEMVGIAPLSESRIIEGPAGVKRLLQAFTLLASRIHSEFVRLLRHASDSRYTAS